jgi:hypothetical protein
MTSRSGADPRPAPLLPLLLLILALGDLSTELRLLFDHFTVTTLLEAIRHHPLALVVLLAQPSLWRRYGRGRPQPKTLNARPSDP